MLDLKNLTGKPAWATADEAATLVSGLIRTARLAAENTTSGGNQADRDVGIASTLEVAEMLMRIVMEGTEGLAEEPAQG
ncbi:hypothetical protein C8J30_102334 [Rhodobacter viridis]|uniref:DUF3077 domain-containing protein n=1 Tax=Rhodobacter viridis TaxID=1054202 RepID=A0A318U1L0_9RHOB|nr:hypothetical protein [Rhodobacter viridis]PYF12019.1 hypothetical protein C8J30_102334 [Rhodobacter viridis]